MSKTYIAATLRRPATPRSNKLKDAASAAASSSSLSSVQVNPAGSEESVFWKYFGLDEDGGLYVKTTESGDPRNFWTYGNLAAGGMKSESDEDGVGVLYLRELMDIYHNTSGILRADGAPISDGDGLAYDVTNSRWYARPRLVAGTDYVVPSTLSNYLTTAAAAAAYAAKSLEGIVAGIQALIPSDASSSNQLADKAFVNSSIASNTGTFQGTFSSTAQLPTSGVSTNDYAFVTTTDAYNNTVYKRYKYNGVQWVFEYSLNNSSFTAAQWNAINSGVTMGKVSGYDAHLADDDIHITSAERTAWNAKTSNLGTITGITMNGVSKGTSGDVDLGTVITSLSGYVQDGEMESYVDSVLADYQTKLTSASVLSLRSINLGDQDESLVVPGWETVASMGDAETLATALADPSRILPNSMHRWLTDALIDTWNAKQNAMSAGTDYLTPSQIAASYLPLRGGTLTGSLTLSSGHLTLPRAGRIRLDANGDAYLTRGSDTDYGLYICAGHEANGTTRAKVYFEASAFMPGQTNTDFGADWLPWGNIYAKRWYPDPVNAPTAYIEWDSTNGAFKINGPIYSTGQIAAGGIISND